MEIAQIMFLEDKVEKLEKELLTTRKQLLEARISKWKKEQTDKMDDMASGEEMAIVYQLLEAHIIFSLYDNGATVPENFFLEKVAGMLAQDEDDILHEYDELLVMFSNLDEFMSEDDVSEKLNFFRDNRDAIEQDDFSNLHV